MVKKGEKLSEDHKAKLALAREKALEVRRKNKDIKERAKTLTTLEKTIKDEKVKEKLNEIIKPKKESVEEVSEEEIEYRKKPKNKKPKKKKKIVYLEASSSSEDSEQEVIYRKVRKPKKEKITPQQEYNEKKFIESRKPQPQKTPYELAFKKALALMN